MKFLLRKYYILSLLLFALTVNAQQNFTAIITDPQTGSENGNVFLDAIIKDINQRADIDRVIILGNLTATGSYDEFDRAAELLKGFTKKYFVSGGQNDYLLSELNGFEITQSWGDDKFHIVANGYDIYIINTISKYTSNGYIDIETLDWVKDNPESTDSLILVFSFYPVNKKVINGYKFSNNFTGKRIIPISPDFTKKKRKKGRKIITDEIKTNSLSDSKAWNYNLLSTVNDTLYLYNVSAKDSIPKLISFLPITKVKPVSKVDSTALLPYYKHLSVNWQVDFGTTTESGVLYSDKNFFTANNNGVITCLNANGSKKWSYETNSTIKTNILREKDLIIAAGLEGDLFTINANNGDLVQVIGTGETIASNITMIDMVYNDMQTRGIIFGTAAGNIYCYELYSLEMVWDGYLSDNKIVSVTKAGMDKIVLKDNKETIYCVNSSNGILIWKWHAKTKTENGFFNSDVISDKNQVYISDQDGIVHCIDLLLGTEKWKRKVSSTGKLSITNDKKYIVTRTDRNKIVLISLKNRKVKKEIKLPGDLRGHKLNFIAAENEGIYLGFDNGLLDRINKKYKIEKIIFSGVSPLISFNKMNGKKFVINNLDGKILEMSEK